MPDVRSYRNNQSTFALDMQQFIERVGERADQAVRYVMFATAEKIVMRSPVKTGRFRGNWQFGSGSRPAGVRAGVDPSGGATIARLSASISGATTPRSGRYYLVNNLPYAVPLEYGYSSQAPNGMVRISLIEAEQAMRRFVEGQT